MDPLTGTVVDAPAMSSATKVEEDDVQSRQQCNSSDPEFLKLVKPEVDPPSSAPSETGLIKPTPATDLGAMITDLKNESCKEANQEFQLVRLEMKGMGDEYDELTPWQEAVCSKDVGKGLINELTGFSGMEAKVESETAKEEDYLEVSSRKNEDMSAVSSEVLAIRLIVEEASANEKVFDDVRDDEDGAQSGREAVFINDEEESVPPTSVESILLEINTKEVQLTKDEMAANDDEDDGPPPGWEAKVVNDEVESVVHASHESTLLEVKMEEVQPTNLVKPEFENNDGDGGPQPRWEAMITKDEVVHVPISVECIPWEIQMKEAHNNLVKPKLEYIDGDNEPQTGWEATITKDVIEHVPPMSVGSIPWEIQMKEAQPTPNNLVKLKLENNDGDDGPQPEWEATITKDEVEYVPPEIQMKEAQPTQTNLVKPELENNDGDDEPPPGREATITKDEVELVPLMSVESIPLVNKTEKLLRTKNTLAAPDLENDDGIDGLPPGFEPTIFNDDVELETMPLAFVENIPLEIKTEEMCSTKDKLAAPGAENNNENDGPPPGWETSVTKDEVEAVPSAFGERIMLDIKTEELQPTKENIAAPENCDDNDRQPSGWEAALSKESGAEDGLVKLAKRKEREDPRPSPRPPLPCKAPSPINEMGQVVCGSCQRLLSHAKGAKYVQCACCQTVNFVLEAHQVGQVYCRNCSVLLMYCFGSPAVKCSGCKFVTQITPHNRRPPLSEQGVTLQSQLAQLCPRSTTNLAQ